jgi:hypothetical protein
MHRTFKKVSVMLILALLVSMFASISAFAEGIKGEELNLIDDKSGYKIIVPNFVEIKKVKLKSEEAVFEGNVIVMEIPQKNSEGTYTIFEVITTDKKAKSLDSYPGYVNAGQMGNVYGDFSNTGRFSYDLKREVGIENGYNFNFNVHDKNGKNVFEIHDLNFMFVNKGEASNTAKVNVTLAKPTASKVLVNGQEVAFQAYNINNNNYFKLRDLAMVVNGTEKNFEVSWDGAKNAISLESDKAYTPAGGELSVSDKPAIKEAKPTASTVYINGKELKLIAYNINGNNYFKLRDIGKAVNFGITFDAASSTIGIDTSTDYTEQ